MTAVDSTARLIEADAQSAANTVAGIAFTVAAWVSLLGFGALVGFVVFMAVTL